MARKTVLIAVQWQERAVSWVNQLQDENGVLSPAVLQTLYGTGRKIAPLMLLNHL
jgi:hypothetical protein